MLAAAVTAILREGRHVPMATIAAEAGLGVATLYRRYPNRTALLDALTHRSFELLHGVATEAEARTGSALAAFSWWWDRCIDERDQLVLPLSRGPSTLDADTRSVQLRLHHTLRRILERGQRDGTIRDDVGVRDIILFGAMLVTPLHGARDWTRVARRHKQIYLDGLAQTRSGPTS